MRANKIYRMPHPSLTVGSACVVRNDRGELIESEILSEPWRLGHGQWVVKVKGFSGGYDVERVQPKR
jgi:hypothetical protein